MTDGRKRTIKLWSAGLLGLVLIVGGAGLGELNAKTSRNNDEDGGSRLGYNGSCNAACREARGRIVLPDPEVRVVPNTLTPYVPYRPITPVTPTPPTTVAPGTCAEYDRTDLIEVSHAFEGGNDLVGIWCVDDDAFVRVIKNGTTSTLYFHKVDDVWVRD